MIAFVIHFLLSHFYGVFLFLNDIHCNFRYLTVNEKQEKRTYYLSKHKKWKSNSSDSYAYFVR